MVLAVTSYQTYQVTNDQIVAKEVVREWLGLAPYDTRRWCYLGSGTDIILIGEGPLPPLETLSTMMEQKLAHKGIIRVHTIPEKSVTYPSLPAGL